MMVKFDHMAMPVTDPKASRDWYVKNFGFAVEFENAGVIAIKDDADFTVFLYTPTGALAGAKVTITLQVKDVEAKHRELVAAGVKFDNRPANSSGAMAPSCSIPTDTCSTCGTKSRCARRAADDAVAQALMKKS